jgi:CspA family cold shock protein
MAIGTVKWFNDQKGYGFIKQDGVAEDIFVHHTAIKMEGFRTLTPGEAVDFEIKTDDKGMKAVNVMRPAGDVPVPQA